MLVFFVLGGLGSSLFCFLKQDLTRLTAPTAGSTKSAGPEALGEIPFIPEDLRCTCSRGPK